MPPHPPHGSSEFRSHLIWLLHSVSTPLLKSSHAGFCVPSAQNNLAEPGVNHHHKNSSTKPGSFSEGGGEERAALDDVTHRRRGRATRESLRVSVRLF